MPEILFANCMHEVPDTDKLFYFPIEKEWVCERCFNAFIASMDADELAEHLGIDTNIAKEVL